MSMRLRTGLILSSVLLSSVLLVACDPETLPPPADTTSTGMTTPIGGTGGSMGGTGGTGAGGETGAAGGTGGSTPCGNGVIDLGEACDGDLLDGATCESLGYQGGALACSAACSFDVSGCTGAETSCADGVDNDGDALTDCEEAECAPVCDDPCAGAEAFLDPDDTSGSTFGHAAVVKSSCVVESGPEVVHAVTAVETGMLDAVLIEDGSASFSISIRTSCADDASELACNSVYSVPADLSKKVSVPITAGDTVFVVVDGEGAATEGTFSLSIASRPILCGDGIEDSVEACDDGNVVSGDGCSAACALELVEPEPNDTLATAVPYAEPYYGAVSPAGDVDVVQIDVASPGGLVAAVTGFGDAACVDGSMDPLVTLLDSMGSTLAINDDGQPGSLCSLAAAGGLDPGTYYAKIEASPAAPPGATTFPYKLTVTVVECGDGTVSPSEECDDGNAANGDGCSSACAFEVTETEPNGTLATADVYTSSPADPWVARIDPDNDVDVVSIGVPGPSSKLTARTLSPDQSLCPPGADTYVEIVKADGTTLADNDDNGTYCSTAVAENLPAGTYYARIRATPTLDMTLVYVFPYAVELTVE